MYPRVCALSLVTLVSSGVEPLPATTSSARQDGAVERFIVATADTQIEVIAQGRGPVIVMLPSLGRSARDYDVIAKRLAEDRFRVLRPEPRGVGQSRGPMQSLTIHDYARDVATVIEHEHAGPVVVVGHGWGSYPARQLATDRPDLVKGVVLAAASAGKVPPGSTELPIAPEIRRAIDCAGDLALSDAERLTCLRRAFFAPGNDPSVWLTGWHPEAHEAEDHARNATPVDDYFAAGTAPILDLQAEEDVVAPRRFSGVLKSMLGERVTTVVIPNAGHALAPEQPAAMADAIAAFARRVHGHP
jgi:pimeloyl-ACP methyl ester carboxylesterase